ncbi:MAG: sugar transferase [Saccharofermentans sp.]|nr:sugar transferase [Saccharofermentans sp.]
MDSRENSRAKHIDFILIDLFCVEVAYLVSIILRYGPETFSDLLKPEFAQSFNDFRTVNVVLIAAYIVLMLFTGPHHGIVKRGHIAEIGRITLLNCEMIFVLIAFFFAAQISTVYSRLMIGYIFLIDIVLMMTLRTIRKLILRIKFLDGTESSGVLLVAQKDTAEDFVNTLIKNNSGFYHFKGIIFTDGFTENYYLGIPVIKEKEILDFVKETPINDVYMLTRAGGRLASQFIGMGITVHRAMDLETPNMVNATINQIGNYTVVTSTITRASMGELLIKRVFDIMCSIIGLAFTGIFAIILAPIIKIQAPGPVFFSQTRVGKNGKTFKMYKFRSMYMDAEERKKELMSQNEMNGLMFKMKNDPRIFPAGKFIRKTSIDEFPQFWNILKGDMSLIGTRPPTLDEYENYKRHHMSRLAMKPGLTGMWQVSGRSDITDFEEIVRLDNEYIRNFSIGLDIKIMFKTFGAVFGMKGSK